MLMHRCAGGGLEAEEGERAGVRLACLGYFLLI
jgi:hypothetical protein